MQWIDEVKKTVVILFLGVLILVWAVNSSVGFHNQIESSKITRGTCSITLTPGIGLKSIDRDQTSSNRNTPDNRCLIDVKFEVQGINITLDGYSTNQHICSDIGSKLSRECHLAYTSENKSEEQTSNIVVLALTIQGVVSELYVGPVLALISYYTLSIGLFMLALRGIRELKEHNKTEEERPLLPLAHRLENQQRGEFSSV